MNTAPDLFDLPLEGTLPTLWVVSAIFNNREGFALYGIVTMCRAKGSLEAVTIAKKYHGEKITCPMAAPLYIPITKLPEALHAPI